MTENALVSEFARTVAAANPNSLQEVSKFVKILCIYMSTTHNAAAFAEAGIIEVVAATILKFMDAPTILTDSFSYLALLAMEDEGLSQRLVDAGLVELVLGAKNFVDKRTFAKDSFLLAVMLQNCPSVVQRLTSNGGIEYLVEELKLHKTSVRQRPYFALLSLGCFIDTLEDRTRLFEKGAIGSAIDYMAQNLSYEGAIAPGLFFLGNVSINSIPIKVEIGRLGGIRLAVSAMRKYPEDHYVQSCGLSCLWNTTWSVNRNKVTAAEVGGISAILEAMNNHLDRVQIQKSGCGALENILSLDATHARYCKEVVIRTLERARARYPDCVKISQVLASLKRIQDPRVADAIARGVCTKVAFPKCVDRDCGCDSNIYCSRCCVQQDVYRCIDCDGEYSIKIYCQVCWQKYHANHKCIKMFVSSRCCTLV